MVVNRSDSLVSTLPQMEVSRATQTNQSQLGVPHHLPYHDPHHHHPAHGGQPRGDWHWSADDPHLGPSVHGAHQVEN